jgi:hypothetical protein
LKINSKKSSCKGKTIFIGEKAHSRKTSSKKGFLHIAAIQRGEKQDRTEMILYVISLSWDKLSLIELRYSLCPPALKGTVA